MVGGGYTGLWTALLRQGARPRPRRACCSRRPLRRLGRVRPQRRLLRGQPHPRLRQRARALARRARRARAAGPARTSTASRRPSASYGIDCDFERTGELERRHRAAPGRRAARGATDAGGRARRRRAAWTREASAREVDSPTYLGGRCTTATAPPWSTRPGWPGDCRQACLDARRAHPRGHPRSTALARRHRRDRAHRRRVGPAGRVALATNAFPPLLRRLRLITVPVYDYVLMTEPLDADAARLDRLGRPAGHRRRGQPVPLLPAHPRQPHPLGRLRRDLPLRQPDRRASYDQRAETFALLAEHFFATFPQLEGLRFTHRWGGVIDTCTRFSPFFGTAYGGRVAYALGYTGLGRGRHPVRGRGDAGPAGRRGHRADPAADGAARSRCRSRRSRCGSRDPADPLVAWPGRRPTTAGAAELWLKATGPPRPGLRLLHEASEDEGEPRSTTMTDLRGASALAQRRGLGGRRRAARRRLRPGHG